MRDGLEPTSRDAGAGAPAGTGRGWRRFAIAVGCLAALAGGARTVWNDAETGRGPFVVPVTAPVRATDDGLLWCVGEAGGRLYARVEWPVGAGARGMRRPPGVPGWARLPERPGVIVRTWYRGPLESTVVLVDEIDTVDPARTRSFQGVHASAAILVWGYRSVECLPFAAALVGLLVGVVRLSRWVESLWKPPPQHLCGGCRYDLRGLRADGDGLVICPECGAPRRPGPG